MAIVYADTFDHYTTIADKGWSGGFGWGAPTISASAARTGGQGLYNATNMRPGTARLIGGSATEGVIGVAHLGNNASNAYNTYYVAGVGDAAQYHLWLSIGAFGQIEVRRMNGTAWPPPIGSTAGIITPNVFYYLEMAFSIHDTTGTVKVYVNGSPDPVLDLSGVDTRNGGNGQFTYVALGSFTDQVGNGTQGWDDLVVQTGTQTPLGDCRVENLMPNANGNSSVLVGSDGNSTDNYLLVDEKPGSSTDYVESSTPGDKDTYGYENLTLTGTVKGVQIAPLAAKTDAGARSIVSVARHSGTEVDSAASTLTTSYLYYPDVRETKPGGGAWSTSDVNAAEFGVKVNA